MNGNSVRARDLAERGLRTLAVSVLLISLPACRSWRVDGPPRTTARPALTVAEDSYIDLPVELDAEELRRSLEATLKRTPLISVESPELSLRLLANEKTYFEEPQQVIEVPYRAASCLVKKVPRQVTRRVRVGIEAYKCYLQPWKWGRCVRDVVKDVVETVIDDVTECTPEQLQVAKTVLTPVIKLRETITPTTARVKLRAQLEKLNWDIQGNAILLSPSISATTTIEVRQGVLGEGLSLRGAVECTASITPTADARFSLIEHDQEVRPKLTVQSVKIELDKLCVPGVAEAFDVVGALNPFVGLLKQQLSNEIEKGLLDLASSEVDRATSKLNLTRHIRDLAEPLQAPQMIDPDLWLAPNLIGIELGQIQGMRRGEKTLLRVAAGVRARPELHFEQKPQRRDDPLTVALGAVGDRFVLAPRGVISLQAVASRLDSLLRVEISRSKPKYRDIRSNVDVYQSGERLVFAVALSRVGPLNSSGTLYLTALPVFEPRTGTIRLVNVRFDVATEEFLARAAAWVLDSRIEQYLEDRLQFAVADSLQATLRRVSNFSIATSAGTLSGSVKDIRLGSIWVDEGMLNFTLRAVGTSRFVAQLR